MTSSSVFVATVPNGSAEAAERAQVLLSATCTQVSVQKGRDDYELRYTKLVCRASLRSESTVLRKTLKMAMWEGLPRQFKGDWLRLQPETTASGKSSSGEAPDPTDSTDTVEPHTSSQTSATNQQPEADQVLPVDLGCIPAATADLSVALDQLTDADGAAELCALLGIEEAVRIRTSGEGVDKVFSLVDVASLVSGKTAQNAWRDVRRVLDEFDEVSHAVRNFQFDGRGQRQTAVAPLRTTLLVLLRLRSRAAQRLSAKMVDVFVRFVGGDPDLAKEVLSIREFQEHLASQQPEHPLRAFGATVEQETSAARPPPPQDVWRTPAPQGIGDWDSKHYVLGSLTYPDMCKTGSTKRRMDERLKEINSKQNRDLGLYVVLVYHHEGPLEQRVRCKLDAWGCRQPPSKYGVNGVEFRIAKVDAVRAAIDEVKKECENENEVKKEVKKESENEQGPAIDVEEQEMQNAANSLKLNRDVFQLEREKRDYDLDWEVRKLDAEEKLEARRLKRRRDAADVSERELEVAAKHHQLELEVTAKRCELELEVSARRHQLENAKRGDELEFQRALQKLQA